MGDRQRLHFPKASHMTREWALSSEVNVIAKGEINSVSRPNRHPEPNYKLNWHPQPKSSESYIPKTWTVMMYTKTPTRVFNKEKPVEQKSLEKINVSWKSTHLNSTSNCRNDPRELEQVIISRHPAMNGDLKWMEAVRSLISIICRLREQRFHDQCNQRFSLIRHPWH